MNRMQDKLKASISPAKTGETAPTTSPEAPAAAPAAAARPAPRTRPAAKPAAKPATGNKPAGTPPMSVWPD